MEFTHGTSILITYQMDGCAFVRRVLTRQTHRIVARIEWAKWKIVAINNGKHYCAVAKRTATNQTESATGPGHGQPPAAAAMGTISLRHYNFSIIIFVVRPYKLRRKHNNSCICVQHNIDSYINCELPLASVRLLRLLWVSFSLVPVLGAQFLGAEQWSTVYPSVYAMCVCV